MTNQEKIKYLKRYLSYEPEIVRLQDEIERWRSRSERITAGMGATGGGGTGDRIQGAVEKICELEDMLSGQLVYAIRARMEVEKAIASVSEKRLQTLLRFRYIEGWTWERIAVSKALDYRWILRLHGQALCKLTIESHIRSML